MADAKTPPPPAPTAAKPKTKPSDADPLKGFSQLRLNESPSSSSSSSTLSLDDKVAALRAITSGAFSSEQEAQLRALLVNKPQPVAYNGFEPSGRVTLAQGLLAAINAKRMLTAGCRVRFWVGDLFAVLNNRFGGDLKKIQSVSAFLVEVWKALGLDAEKDPNFEVLLASAEIARHADQYWSTVLDVANQFTVERVQQCAPIMSRSVDDPVGNTNRIMYPLMQVADGFLLDADIYQLGSDQEEVLNDVFSAQNHLEH